MSALPRSNRGGNLDVQRERAIVTRSAIVVAARVLFAEQGFHAVGTTEIALRAGLTRGALYHHFADKEGLFTEVFQVVADELLERSSSAVAALSGDVWSQVTEAFRHYLLLVAENEEYRRILLIDGPSVLGWARWRDLQSEFVARGTADALQMLMDQGLVRRQPTMALACMIQAGLHDAALTIASATLPSASADEAAAAFFFILQGIRQSPAAGDGAFESKT